MDLCSGHNFTETFVRYRFIIAGKVTPNDLDNEVFNCTIQIADLYIIFPPMIVDQLYHKDLETGLQDFIYLLNYGNEMQQKIYKEIDFNPRNFPDDMRFGDNNGTLVIISKVLNNIESNNINVSHKVSSTLFN